MLNTIFILKGLKSATVRPSSNMTLTSIGSAIGCEYDSNYENARSKSNKVRAF